MRVLFIVDDHVSIDPDGQLTATLASTRIRLIFAMNALHSFGQHAKLIANTTPEAVLESSDFLDAETIVFGKIFQDYTEVALRAKAMGKVLIMDITDNPTQFDMFEFIRKMSGLADAAIVPTARMADVSRSWLSKGSAIVRIEDTLEAEFLPPSANFRRAPERLELVWYGSPANAVFMNVHIQGLTRLAETVPMRLTMVSKGPEIFDGFINTHSEQTDGPLVGTFVEWSPLAQRKRSRGPISYYCRVSRTGPPPPKAPIA